VVILLDEPTAACDAETCAAVEEAIVKSGSTVIMITHDERQSQRIAHNRLIMTPV
jgi:ABC-type phosphate transport system ATPase subunit